MTINEQLVQIFTDIAVNLELHKANPKSQFALELNIVAIKKIQDIIESEKTIISKVAMRRVNDFWTQAILEAPNLKTLKALSREVVIQDLAQIESDKNITKN